MSKTARSIRIPNPLHNYSILVTDADQQMATVLKTMLGEMGFSNVEITGSGQDAFEQLQYRPFDFLITEWNIEDLDGISLISRIRRSPSPPNPTLPIMMVTGRAEEVDVATARDAGINEYVVKPFSAESIYERLERMVEKPRNFIFSQAFVGPDRRHKSIPLPEGSSNRRTLKITPQKRSEEITGKLIGALPSTPTMLTPDFSLKKKLGAAKNLSSLITQEVLNSAQASIEAITEDSLKWIKENMTEVKNIYQTITHGNAPADTVNKLSEVALTINSRAGTFGYGLASKVAYMLHLFSRKHLKQENPDHHTVIQKHIEVLQIILSGDTRLVKGKKGEQVMMELHNLAIKYAS